MTTWIIRFDDNGEGLSTGALAELEGLATTLGFSATISSEPVPAPPEDRYVGKIKGHVQTLRTVIEEGGETYTPEGMVIFLRTLLRDIEWLLDADPAPVPAPRTFNPFTKIEPSPLTCVCGSSGEDCEREIEGRHGACCRHCVHLADQRERSATPVPAPRCPHNRVEMLAHQDDIPPDGPCLVWSPICRDCGDDVPMAAPPVGTQPKGN